MPCVVPGQVEVLPPEWVSMGKSFVVDGSTVLTQGRDGVFQVHRVPEDNGGDHQVERPLAR